LVARGLKHGLSRPESKEKGMLMANTGKKLRVGLFFGGCSAEHHISLDSALAVMTHLDTDKYEVVPIGISRTGAWLPGISPAALLASECQSGNEAQEKAIDVADRSRSMPEPLAQALPVSQGIDVAFPMMHGAYGEDGALQGLLEMVGIPYVGCGVIGSALGMDKEKMKMLFHAVGLLIVDSMVYRRQHWERSPEKILDAVEQRLGYPCFVKPANGGSSIGTGKAYNRSDLRMQIETAAGYDSKMVIERAIDCRELECSVLGNADPMVSVVGEVVTDRDFYDYHAKYLDDTTQIIIPADIPEALALAIREQAIQAFLALDLSGLARVDFFLEKETDRLYINEVNTLPSFTPQCMYPRLCAVSGLSYTLLLDYLIELALERHADRRRNRIC
jgi:D-alanine-D-alanine ligase